MRSILFMSCASAVNAYTTVVVDRFMTKNIDPIVFPGQYNKSHMHTFFGSDAVTVNTSTSSELQSGCSTARNPNDYSVYWVPTLVYTGDGGVQAPVPISRFSAYYREFDVAEVPMPQNLKMVAGNTSATSSQELDSHAGVSWACEDSDDQPAKERGAFPLRTCSTHLQTLLFFPNCVNEETLEYAYSGTQNWNSTFRPDNRCPEGMKRMPQLKFSIRYDLRSVLPDGWEGTPPLELSCGSSFCSHGDFINGWLPEAAENMLTPGTDEFVGIDGPDGTSSAGSICGAGNATDADPDHGTSDYAESMRLISKRAASRRRSIQ